MNKCICDVCRTENEMHYEYCKNCGNKLKKNADTNVYSKPVTQTNNTAYTPISSTASEQQSGVYSANGQSVYNQHKTQESIIEQTYGITEIDGVKTEDLAAYIGPNSRRIISKFSKMELTGSKVSWCWPAAVWGILGPIGIAVWFIYRKMYKLGIILLAIGVLLSGLETFAEGFGPSRFEEFYSSSEEEYLEEIPELEPDYNENNYATVIADIAYLLSSFIPIASIIFSGLFSVQAYKKHTIKKIKRYNLVNTTERYHQIGLMNVGGTAAGMAVLGILVAVFLSNTISEIIYIFI